MGWSKGDLPGLGYEIEVIYNGSSLSYNILANNKKTPTIADAKEVSVLVDHLIAQQNFSVA
ncbi:hypothetical protein FACS1894122_07940 [Alphaproteobacteria bacterium]|nr:hypothetical protein FACS1894122_07940 [Alphaproteobacteria bacterium]